MSKLQFLIKKRFAQIQYIEDCANKNREELLSKAGCVVDRHRLHAESKPGTTFHFDKCNRG